MGFKNIYFLEGKEEGERSGEANFNFSKVTGLGYNGYRI